MNKITLNLGDIKQLCDEINGSVNTENGMVYYEGFLNQNISVLLKYELSELGEYLEKEKIKIEKIKDELILKYGEAGVNGFMLSKFIVEKDIEGNITSKIQNPKYELFESEMNKLLSVEKEFEFPNIAKEDLIDIGKTKDNYIVLFRLIKKGTL